MDLQVTRACAVKGKRLETGATLSVGTDISAEDAQLLVAMGRAVNAQPKPKRGRPPKVQPKGAED